MDERIIHVVGLVVKAGKVDELRRDLSSLVEPSRKEDGNIRYELFEDQGTPGQFVFVEQWASEAARARHHGHGPHIAHFHAHGVNNVARTAFAHMLKRIA